MSKSIIDHCINILKREDVKKEIKNMFQPIIDIILQEIYPYIYLSLLFVIISFLLILAIFIIVLQSNSKTRYFSPLKGV
jgi:hypothetical protein